VVHQEGRVASALEDRMKDWVTVGDLCHEHNHQDWAVSKRKKWIGVIKLSK
jgi:hypothetical protein